MGNLTYSLAILAFALLCACNQPQYNGEQAAGSVPTAGMKDQCYQAVFEKDTGDLRIRTDKDGKVTGDLVMKYGQKPNEVERVINKGKVDEEVSAETRYF